MRKMSEVEANGSALVEDIIDVDGFDFDDNEAWLYLPTQSEKRTVNDIYTWLKTESESVLPTENTTRKCIDTRTFTRPKKRSSRMSFESIFETISPSPTNVWKAQGANFTNLVETANKVPIQANNRKEDVVPLMLKTATSNFLASENLSTSGQESMEVFLNMSHSKGIDSFINLTEPGFSDPLMNVSQPSIFCSSITSLPSGDYDRDDRPGDLTSSNINETFSKIETLRGTRNECPADRTFTNRTQIFDRMELNETYNAEKSMSKLSSTFVSKECGSSQTLDKKDPISLDTTYFHSDMEKNEPVALDATFFSMEPRIEETERNRTLTIESHKDKNECRTNTNCSTPMSYVDGDVHTINSVFSTYETAPLDSTFKYPVPHCNQSTPEPLNSTFKTITKHLEQSRTYNPALSSTFKAPTSLRRELLAEIQRSGGDRRLDSTYNHVDKDHASEKEKGLKNHEVISDQSVRNDIVPTENKYNTYKKESSSLDRTRIRLEGTGNGTEACGQKSQQQQQERKYYTFTKKTAALNHAGKTEVESTERDVDSTFTKPFSKLQKRKQQHIPRMLSKLPQFLQKSNPNLVSSSLKAVNVTTGGCANPASVAYKGSQPNIVREVEKSLTNKLYSLGKMKSGSEQRLLELNSNAAEFQLTAAGGSTESIESTQSAHSAPDLDDRLSTCSDSSHNSYSARTMNIEQLHQIVRMQEESLKQESTPKLNRRVLENTWIETKKDLPSPIPKNGVDCCETDSAKLTGHYAKTSSPLLSPNGSNQSLNADGHPMENMLQQQNDVTVVKKIETSSKPTARMENRTRLRQPTNWAPSGLRAPNAISSIPRPPSRIPALRFTRPAPKNPQTDVKRGYT